MDATTNSLNWFEIPAIDISRAKKFYETLFNFEMSEHDMNGMKMAFFPYAPGSGHVSGGLAQSEMHNPSTDGAVVYLNGNPNLDAALGKVEAAGGKVVMPKTQIDENIGYMAIFIDSEGNRVALHSQG